MSDHIEKARALIGTPWKHQGRNPAVGIDCIGMVTISLAIKEGTVDYRRDPSHGKLEAALEAQFGPPIPKEDMRHGDVVAIAYGKCVRHVGLVAQGAAGLNLIHTDQVVVNEVTEHPLDAKWLDRIKKVYRP